MTNLKDAVERVAEALRDPENFVGPPIESLQQSFEAAKVAVRIAILSALSGETEPVAWRVKDFADGWILCHTEAEAKREAEGCGNTIQPLYAHPPATWQGMETLPDFDGECFATWQPDYPELWSMHVYREVKDLASGMKPGVRKVFEDQLAEAKGWFPLPSPPTVEAEAPTPPEAG